MFQTRFFREKYFFFHIHVHIHFQIHVHFHVRVRVCVFFLLCCAVSCRVPRVVGWLGVVWCCRHVVVVVFFVLVSWSLSLRRHRKTERRRESKKEMAAKVAEQNSLKSVLSCFVCEYIATGKSGAFND